MRASPEEFDLVRRKCDALRNAIRLSAVDADWLLGWTRRFPKGCCDHASRLLFAVLYELDFRDVGYVNAKIGDERHVWLEWKDLIIDITADQFSEFDSYVLTRDSEWHRFKEANRGFAAYGNSEREAYQDLISEFPFPETYEAIMEFWIE